MIVGINARRIVGCSELSTALIAYLAAVIWLSRTWPGAGQAPVSQTQLGVFWITYALLWAALGVMATCLWRGKTRRGGTRAVVLLVVIAAVVRVVIALAGPPVLSDDIWRYIHDGAVLGRGDNPYAQAPAEMAPKRVPEARVHQRISYPELVTIYQPASQYVFAALSEANARLPAAARQADAMGDHTFRIGFVLFDVLIVGMLAWRLRAAGRSPWWASLYALHPLALAEIAGSGHQDVIGIAAMLAGLMLIERANMRW